MKFTVSTLMFRNKFIFMLEGLNALWLKEKVLIYTVMQLQNKNYVGYTCMFWLPSTFSLTILFLCSYCTSRYLASFWVYPWISSFFFFCFSLSMMTWQNFLLPNLPLVDECILIKQNPPGSVKTKAEYSNLSKSAWIINFWMWYLNDFVISIFVQKIPTFHININYLWFLIFIFQRSACGSLRLTLL